MKKAILSAGLFLLALGSINATTTSLSYDNYKKEVRVYNISSFCKLIQKGDLAVVKSMIDSGEDVNKKSNGLTPLMFAARHNRVEIAKLLIANGAKLKARSDKGQMTALQMAEKFKANEVAKVLKVSMKKKKKK